MDRIIIALTGMPASGKSTVSKQMKELGGKHIHIGSFIWNWLRRKKIKLTSKTSMRAGIYFHKLYHDLPILSWLLERIKKTSARVYVLDSLRSVDEYSYLKKRFKQVHLVAIVADHDVRYKRAKARKRFGTVLERAFELRDQEELQLGVGKLIDRADYVIDGNKTVDSVRHQAAQIYKKIT